MKRPSPLLSLPPLLSLILSACSAPALPDAQTSLAPPTTQARSTSSPTSPTPTSDLPSSQAAQMYSDTELQSMLASLRIDQVPGSPWPLSGAYRVAPAGRINWYFANLGLRYFVDAQPQRVAQYLSTYIAFTRATSDQWRIHDVNFADAYTPAGPTLLEPDSDDAYAGTFLSLAAAYVGTQNDRAWFTQHRADLLNIAQANIINSLKASGLPSVFQNPAQAGGVGYLMDACEAYAGLRDLASLLEGYGDPAAPQLRAAAGRVAQGIAGLYDAAQGRWQVADVPAAQSSGLYPLGTAQIFAEVYGVPAATAAQAKVRADAGWATLNALAPNWYKSSQYDAFPWVMLSYAAMKRGQVTAGLSHLEYVKKSYAFLGGRLTINELGFYRAASQQWQAYVQSSATASAPAPAVP